MKSRTCNNKQLLLQPSACCTAAVCACVAAAAAAAAKAANAAARCDFRSRPTSARAHRRQYIPSAASPLGKLSVSAHLSQKVSVVAAERQPVRGAMLPLTDTLMAAAPAARMSSANPITSPTRHALPNSLWPPCHLSWLIPNTPKDDPSLPAPASPECLRFASLPETPINLN